MHTQLSLYDYVSSITVPMGRYIAGLFYFQGNMPHDAAMTMIHVFPWMPVRLVYCCSCYFYCPNVGNDFEDTYYMQKGREENECKEQKKCSENKDGVKEQTSS